MILYHASTSYHVLCCIVHKLAYHKEEEATFMIVEHMLPKNELEAFISSLNSFSWFDKIIPVPEGTFRLSHGKALNLHSTELDILEVINNICDEVDKWHPFGFYQYKEIYIASDQWSVGVYLLYHKIAHHYFEDASGMLGDMERYLTIIRELNLSNYVISEYLGGVGRSDFVLEKLCDLKNQPEGFFDKKAVDFSIYKLISTMPPALVEDLLSLYNAKQYTISSTEKVAVYMTQFLRTITVKNLEVQERITTLLLDYFAKGHTVIIKPHPKDRWIDYRSLLPGAIILDNSLPSELLPFVLEGDIDLVLTASSTSVGGMSHISKSTISFGTEIEFHYERLHKMYMAAKVIHDIFAGQEIITHNIKRSHLEHFLSLYSIDYSKKALEHSSIFIDGGQPMIWETSNPHYIINPSFDVLIFLNFNEAYTFLANPDLDQNYFIVLKDKRSDKNEIWIYCENEEERRKIMSIKEKTRLYYSGTELEINSEEATALFILNGKMRALQYALKQKEEEEQNQVFYKMNELLKLYQEEEAAKHILLEEEGILYE
jgi:hypothetical protein